VIFAGDPGLPAGAGRARATPAPCLFGSIETPPVATTMKRRNYRSRHKGRLQVPPTLQNNHPDGPVQLEPWIDDRRVIRGSGLLSPEARRAEPRAGKDRRDAARRRSSSPRSVHRDVLTAVAYLVSVELIAQLLGPSVNEVRRRAKVHGLPSASPHQLHD
jgi:hypothetical protein